MQRFGNLSSANFLRPQAHYPLPYATTSTLWITQSHGEICLVSARPWMTSTCVPDSRRCYSIPTHGALCVGRSGQKMAFDDGSLDGKVFSVGGISARQLLEGPGGISAHDPILSRASLTRTYL